MYTNAIGVNRNVSLGSNGNEIKRNFKQRWTQSVTWSNCSENTDLILTRLLQRVKRDVKHIELLNILSDPTLIPFLQAQNVEVFKVYKKLNADLYFY